jgi:hypothetical protein
VSYAGTPLESLPVKGILDPMNASCLAPDPRQVAIELGKNKGALATGVPDLGVDVASLRNFIDHNRSKYAPMYDGAFTVPVLNVYFEKVYNVALPLIVGGIAESTNNGEGWGQVDNLNERSIIKSAIDCSQSAAFAPACVGGGQADPFSNARGLTYIVQHESAHFLGLHHPHDGTASVGPAEGAAPAGSSIGGKSHYYYTMNKWLYDYTASPTTYGHTYGTYEVVDQERLMYGHASEYVKQAQDWLADGYFMAGASGLTSADGFLKQKESAMKADRDLATRLFQQGDYLHSQYAMRNGVFHAKGFFFPAVTPHKMSLDQAAASGAQPTDSGIHDGQEIFAINPQPVFSASGGVLAASGPSAGPTVGGTNLPNTAAAYSWRPVLPRLPWVLALIVAVILGMAIVFGVRGRAED